MTTVNDLLKKNRFSKKVIYRIDDPLTGYKNYEYKGRDKYGQILMKGPSGKESLSLFNHKSKVKIIKLRKKEGRLS